MKISSGIYNNNGYVQIRIWPWAKKDNPKPYVEAGFGCWCEEHIKLAEKRLRVIRDEIDQNKFKLPDSVREITIPEACDIYHRIAFLENRERSVNAIKNVSYTLDMFKKVWPTTKFHKLTPREIREYFNVRLDEGLKPNSVKRHLSVLDAIYTRLIKAARLKDIDAIVLPEFNPVTVVERPSSVGSARTRVATWEELKRIKDYCLGSDPDLWQLIFFAITTLYRKQDAFRAMETGNTRQVAGKTGKLHDMPVKVEMKRIRNFRRRWDALREACNMQDFHWHDWKHTGATLLKLKGTSIEVINEMMEHSDLKTTRIYVNEQQKRFEPEIQRLATCLNEL